MIMPTAQDAFAKVEGLDPLAAFDQVERAEASRKIDDAFAAVEGAGGGGGGAKRIAGAAMTAISDLFDQPLGLSRESMGRLIAQPGDESTDMIKTFNQVVLGGSSIAGDLAFRAVAAPIIGGIAAVSQAAREFGMDDTQSRKLERDLQVLAISTGVVSGTYPLGLGVPKFRRQAKRRIEEAADGLPEQQATAATRLNDAMEEGVAAARQTVGVVEEGLVEPRITGAISKKVVDAAEELLIAGTVRRDKSRLISDQVMELLATNRLTTDEIGTILKKHELNVTDFADLWRVNIKKAAQDMQTLSAVEQRLNALRGDVGAEAGFAQLAEEAGLGADSQALGFWRRADNVRRGLMVSQLATAVRNFETQAGRVGLDVLQQGMDTGLRRMSGFPETRSAADALDPLLRIFTSPRTTKKEVDYILNAFPKEQDRLFIHYSSDILAKGGAVSSGFGAAEKAVHIVNTANRLQEYVVRRAMFAASLDRRLSAEGKSIEDIITRNAVGEIPQPLLRSAVNDALEATFAKNYSPLDPGLAGVAGNFIQAVHKLPFTATLVAPFPRFLVNAIKFQYEFSPFGYLRLMSGTERAAVAAGDMQAISRATIGSGLYLAAEQFRASEFAGEKWYEFKQPDGEIIDLRPFNPFAAYLFVADIRKRIAEGTMSEMSAKDIAFGITASQLRAGTGLFVLDSVLDGVAGLEPNEKGVRAIQDMAGNVLASFAVPMHMIRDFVAEFDQSMAVVRTGREGPHVGVGEGPGGLPAVGISAGPIMRDIPGLAQRLPAHQAPTRSEPTETIAPALRQFTGLSFNKAKNPGERELDRLGFTPANILPTTGNPTADRLIAIRMGPIFEKIMPMVVDEDWYKNLQPATQKFVLNEVVGGIRKRAAKQASGDDPELFARIKIEGIPKIARRAIEELSGNGIRQLLDELAK